MIGVWGLLLYVRGTEQDAFASLWHIEGQLRSAGETEPCRRHRLNACSKSPSSLVPEKPGVRLALSWPCALSARGLCRRRYRLPASHAQGQPTDLLWSLASLGTAYALEASGEFRQAQDAYQRVIDAKPSGLIMEAYLGKGRAAEQSHDVETTIVAYSAVIEQFPARAGALGLADHVEALKARH